MSNARASKGLLQQPRQSPNFSSQAREKWLADAAVGFVSHSESNKSYYSVILAALWPEGHGIPGPALTEKEIRAAVDAHRAASSSVDRRSFLRLRSFQTCMVVTLLMRISY
jgi:hypothetical protein